MDSGNTPTPAPSRRLLGAALSPHCSCRFSPRPLHSTSVPTAPLKPYGPTPTALMLHLTFTPPDLQGALARGPRRPETLCFQTLCERSQESSPVRHPLPQSPSPAWPHLRPASTGDTATAPRRSWHCVAVRQGPGTASPPSRHPPLAGPTLRPPSQAAPQTRSPGRVMTSWKVLEQSEGQECDDEETARAHGSARTRQMAASSATFSAAGPRLLCRRKSALEFMVNDQQQNETQRKDAVRTGQSCVQGPGRLLGVTRVVSPSLSSELLNFAFV